MLKRKHKNILRKAPENLLFEKSFEFVIPRSIEDCCTHLEHLNRGCFSSYNSVYLSSIDQKQIAFHICKSARKSGDVWAVGYLQDKDSQSTRIVGKAGIPAFELMVSFIFVLAGLLFGLDVNVPKGVNAHYLVGFVFVAIGGIIFGSLIWSRGSLINDLKWVGQRVE
jgi:hypothetical protein